MAAPFLRHQLRVPDGAGPAACVAHGLRRWAAVAQNSRHYIRLP
jgi:hypothetical protein